MITRIARSCTAFRVETTLCRRINVAIRKICEILIICVICGSHRPARPVVIDQQPEVGNIHHAIPVEVRPHNLAAPRNALLSIIRIHQNAEVGNIHRIIVGRVACPLKRRQARHIAIRRILAHVLR